METDSPVVYHGTSESRFPPEGVKRSQIQLTSEELRILRDCNRESFYYRCLPLMVAGMGGTYLAVKRGILTGHPRWGPAGKMAAAAVTGWFVGKMSYRSKCEEKFLKLGNSTIGNAVRKKRGYSLEIDQSENYQFPSDDTITPKDGDDTSFFTGDYHSSSGSLNFDKNVPFSELNDSDRPSMDREGDILSKQSQQLRQSTSYDELRKRNRMEYERQYDQPGHSKSDSSQRPWGQTSTESQRRANVGSQEGAGKNAYGDSWDNPKFTS